MLFADIESRSGVSLMYMPSYSLVARLSNLHFLIENYSFGILICPAANRMPQISHLPFVLDKERGPYGTLLSHVARANPISHSFEASKEAIVVFQGPHGYISPSWYSARTEVPTWNYSVVHAYGILHLLNDDELVKVLRRSVEKYERANPDSWSIDELSPSLFDDLRTEIVGFSLEIKHLEGKFKLSQNRAEHDRQGAIAGILRRGDPLDPNLAAMMEAALRKGDG